MKLPKGVGTALCLIAFCFFVAPKAKADAWNRKTIVTFSGPVEVPGVGIHVLPAGTYVFKIMNTVGYRHIVQIFNKNETQVLTTIIAIPNYRLQPTSKTVITFAERPAGEPEALKAWFYPGRDIGEQFVYPRHRAIELAKQNNENVLSTPAEVTNNNMATAPVEGVNPSGQTIPSNQVVAPPPPEMAAAAPPPPPPAPLPKTASDLPLIGLAGLLTLCSGLILAGLLKLSATA